MSLKKLENVGINAVKELRKYKLEGGIPFMIFFRAFPRNHFLLEFPDGTIKEATIDKKINDYVIIREFPSAEAECFRKKHKLNKLTKPL